MSTNPRKKKRFMELRTKLRKPLQETQLLKPGIKETKKVRETETAPNLLSRGVANCGLLEYFCN